MQFLKMLKNHQLMVTLKHLDKNARICTLTEPLWTIPFYLFTPFVSVYMSELGLSDAMIGMISTIYLISQFVFSLMSGALTDKLGRRWCTLLFDVFAWSVPVLLWAFAQNVWCFVVAALFAGTMRITTNSWNLLLIEDEDERLLVRLYSLINIAASLSAFAVLLSYPLVHKFGMVPTVRGMYIFAFVSMTAKFIILFVLGHETRIGKRRMEETRGRSIWSLTMESKGVFRRMLRTPKVMWTIALLACFTGSKSLADTFWPLLVTERMHIPEESLALFSAAKSAVSLICYFIIVTKISMERFKHPLILCFLLQILSKAILIVTPGGSMGLLWITVVLDAMSIALLNPMMDTLQMLSMDPHERARMLGIFFAMMLLATSPLGALGGLLSNINRALPIALAGVLCVVAIWIGHRLSDISAHEKSAAEGA